jgi:hypothetical protein
MFGEEGKRQREQRQRRENASHEQPDPLRLHAETLSSFCIPRAVILAN